MTAFLCRPRLYIGLHKPDFYLSLQWTDMYLVAMDPKTVVKFHIFILCCNHFGLIAKAYDYRDINDGGVQLWTHTFAEQCCYCIL